ncbi:YybS family protein [Bacillus sp. DJP31]|uniref:YybS family protein n=1 Tax=Bacillus sp. DJP31 TaxID=3409789 RepID=UPI003BB808DF
MLALFIVLFITTLYMPFLGSITSLLLSLPFVVFVARNGWKSGIILFIAALILTLLFGSIFAIPLTFIMGSSGVVMGHLYKQNRSKFEVLSFSSIAFILNLLVLYVLVITVFEVNIPEVILQASEDSLKITREMMEKMGQSLDGDRLVLMEETLQLIPLLLPTIIVLTGIIFALITQIFSTLILKRLGFQIEKWPPIREIQLPKSIIWYYLISMIFMIIPLDKDSFLFLAVLNLHQIMQLLMVLQGISFIFYYCYHKNISKGIPITIAIVSLLFQPLLYIVRIIGIIDLGFNLRNKVEQKK